MLKYKGVTTKLIDLENPNLNKRWILFLEKRWNFFDRKWDYFVVTWEIDLKTHKIKRKEKRLKR